MSANKLKLISAGRYKGFHRWLTGVGKSNDEAGLQATCVAIFEHPEAGLIDAYVKFYSDDENGIKALANEVTGFLIADRMGLSQPYPGFIAEIPLKKTDLKNIPKNHYWLKKLSSKKPLKLAWCTRSLNFPTPYHYYSGDMLMVDDLLKWVDVNKAITLDDIVANIDRNLNNLIRIDEGNYSLIDHGSLICPQGGWNMAQLNIDGEYRNLLLHCLYGQDVATVANKMIAIAENCIDLIKDIPELTEWLERLLNDDDFKAFDIFLKNRTITTPLRLAKRYTLC